MRKEILNLLGVQLDTTEHKEKIISALGGGIGILLILTVTSLFIEFNSAGLIVASMGASAVLLFAVPHGPLSQPWAVFGGHMVSAFIGVTCYLTISEPIMAAALAVGLSIGIMYYFRCIHPPGGATALTAVMGGTDIHSLGYDFIVTPVLINVIIILATAYFFNYLFTWRRYPVAIAQQYQQKKEKNARQKQIGLIPRKDLEFALHSMQSFADITEVELEKIYQTAKQHQAESHLELNDIKLGHYYLHGKNDGNGVIRRVIDESLDEKDMLIYKIITGPERKKTQVTTRSEFANWAKHEVIFDDNKWKIK